MYDYYGFPRELYEYQFKSRGDSELSKLIVKTVQGVRLRLDLPPLNLLIHSFAMQAGLRARTSPRSEARGRDGRGFMGPGLDHGVFLPFSLMFGNEFKDIPIVQVSIDGSLEPEANWKLGKALTGLR